MKTSTFLLLFIGLFACHRSPAQEIFSYVEQMPEPTFGLIPFIKANMVYPETAKEQRIQGNVLVKFVVDSTGRVIQPQVKRSVHPLLDSESIRVISMMPDWIPGKKEGVAVNVYYTVPVHFKLEDSAADPVEELPDTTVDLNNVAEPDTVTDPAVIEAFNRDMENVSNISAGTDTQLVMPKPDFGFMRYLRNNLQYPKRAKIMNFDDTVSIHFTVDKTGKVINLKILNPTYQVFIDEIKRVFKEMPLWQPGTINGQPACITLHQRYLFVFGYQDAYNRSYYNLRRTTYKELVCAWSLPVYVRYNLDCTAKK